MIEKACIRCGSDGPFWKMSKTKDGLDSYCQSCRRAMNKRWKENNPEKVKALGRKNQSDRYTRLKKEYVEAYGGACQCCGEEEIHFLTIQHWNGVPDHHKTATGHRIDGNNMIQKIKDEGFPDAYGLLCMNCNHAYGHYGFCPHQPHDEEQRRY